jgi:hypothetical protein
MIKLKRIVMEVIPHAEQRYDTLGDYWTDKDGTLQFRVSDLGDWRYNFSVLLHEFVEFHLLLHKGVPEPDVLAFDLAVEPGSKYADDPGFDPKAPYHLEHVLADTLERLISIPLGFEVSDPWDAAEKLPQWDPK